MHASKPIKFAIGVIGCFPLLAIAAGPSTQPAGRADSMAAGVTPAATDTENPLTDGTSTDDTTPHRSDGTGLGRGRFLRGILPPISDNDRSQAILYLSEHSPNRFAFIQALPDGDRKSNLMDVAARSYLRWMQMMKDDPELYKVTLRRIEVEDKIFGIVSQMRKDAPDNQDAAQSDLRTQVKQWVDLSIQERQIRLDRLAKTVDEQQKKLADDTNNKDSLVAERIKNILSEGNRLFPNPDKTGHERSHLPNKNQ